jgi:hypothetical protein
MVKMKMVGDEKRGVGGRTQGRKTRKTKRKTRRRGRGRGRESAAPLRH